MKRFVYGRWCHCVAIGILVSAGAQSALAATNYVWLSGSHTPPFDTWSTAATNIQAAVDAAGVGNTVLVTNGVYGITNQISITNGITVRSVNGRDVTTVRRSNAAAYYRIFYITNANAVIDGFRVENGNVYNLDGGGIYLAAGTVQNCNVISNSTPNDGSGGGGGLYMGANTVVSNCFIAFNSGYRYGGGVRMTAAGALLADCVMSNNSCALWGGGVYASAGTIRNCLIVTNYISGNTVLQYGGGGVYLTGSAVLLNCTIVHNWTKDVTWGSGIWKPTGGAVTNCIIYYNWKQSAVIGDDITGSLSDIAYSCAPSLTNGVNGNMTANPQFVDTPQHKYRLLPGSPCIDAGTNLASVAADIEGTTRPIDGNGDGVAIHDIGVYEAASPTGGVFRCNFIANTNEGVSSLETVFTAYSAGPNTNGLYYLWDFQNDGTNDASGTGKAVVTNTYWPGIYSVALTLSNAIGEATTSLKTQYIRVWATSLYVATNSSHTSPYTNWSMAATNLQSPLALARNGSVILVSNGTYSATDVVVNDGVKLRSLSGPEQTILTNYSASGRVLDVWHADAVVDGFTITGGKLSSTYGAGVRLWAGALSNCIVIGNSAYNGAAIHQTGTSTVENCRVSGNSAAYHSAGVWVNNAGALLRNCTISNNTAAIFGGGVYMDAGTVRNCLIVTNRVTGNNDQYGGGGVLLAGGLMENCTVANNSVTTNSHAGGVWIYGAGAKAMTNSIVYYNTRGGAATNLETTTSYSTVGYSCAPELTQGVNGNITGDPKFRDAGINNYRLLSGSPCINAGTNRAWMAGATDLDGNPRIARQIVDMGAYELPPAQGTIFSIR